MSNPENVAAITALLTADDIMAASDKIKQLQTFLEFEGHTANSSKYPADGKIGKLTGKDIVDFLKDNPSVLAQTDPSLIERLVDKGYRDDLVTIAQRNPDVRDTLRTRAGEILDGQTPKTINGTQKLRDIQSLLAATGDYTASIDAKTGPATRGALAKANLTTGAAAAFDRAVPLATVTRNTSLALQAVTINQDDYMEALGFTKQGLGLGDGGRAQQHEEAVTNLQVLLRRAGVNVGVDGDYGSQTQAAVKKFQETHGLNPTGTADHETLLKLTSLPSTQYDPRPKADPHNYTVLEHRMIRVAITPDVEAATGTSAEYLNAVWKIESTGSLTLGGGRWSRGPDQFIEGTFTGLAQEYGPAIAQQLSARYGGHPAAALLSAGSSNLDMRYDPYVSAFAAGYYTQESGFDTSNRANYKFAYG
ncbi:MAG: peptidoglycan-binding domain-containing protein, partial [Bdellovibrionales bacterium]